MFKMLALGISSNVSGNSLTQGQPIDREEPCLLLWGPTEANGNSGEGNHRISEIFDGYRVLRDMTSQGSTPSGSYSP